MNEQFFDYNSIAEYISENFIGFCLLILVFFIIYFVDYINNLNAAIYSSIPIMGLPNTLSISNSMKDVKRKRQSIKK